MCEAMGSMPSIKKKKATVGKAEYLWVWEDRGEGRGPWLSWRSISPQLSAVPCLSPRRPPPTPANSRPPCPGLPDIVTALDANPGRDCSGSPVETDCSRVPGTGSSRSDSTGGGLVGPGWSQVWQEASALGGGIAARFCLGLALTHPEGRVNVVHQCGRAQGTVGPGAGQST